jgi:hypothetical protein
MSPLMVCVGCFAAACLILSAYPSPKVVCVSSWLRGQHVDRRVARERHAKLRRAQEAS